MTKWMKELEKAVGPGGFLNSPVDLVSYSFDSVEQHLPEAVVLPETTEEVVAVLGVAARHGVPIVARGLSSGLAGGAVPIRGGIVLSLTRMNRILELDEENMMVRVQAGIITADLQAEVEKRGLFYPPDPGSIRHGTIGGNVSNNAGGPRCLKYGVTGDYVMGLTVVLPDGRVLETGGKAIKNVVGYDLTSLFVGSEGTLGVVTEALLRLVTKPGYVRTIRAEFPVLDDASRSVNAVLSAGIVPAALEFMDETAIGCVEEATGLGLPLDVEALLIVEMDGADEGSVARETEAAARICRENGARQVNVAGDEEERNRLWQARRSVIASLARKAPNQLLEDITVPRSAIPEAIRRIKAISAEHGLPIVIFGHAGDGNLHPTILFDRRDADQLARVEPIVAETFGLALELDGVISGEHGVGLLKLPYVADDLGAVSIEVQRGIKRVFDPQNILNPGKMLPVEQ